MLANLLAPCQALTPAGSSGPESRARDGAGYRIADAGAMDENLVPMETALYRITSVQWHFQQLQQLHNKIARDKQQNSVKRLREISLEIFRHKKEQCKLANPEEK